MLWGREGEDGEASSLVIIGRMINLFRGRLNPFCVTPWPPNLFRGKRGSAANRGRRSIKCGSWQQKKVSLVLITEKSACLRPCVNRGERRKCNLPREKITFLPPSRGVPKERLFLIIGKRGRVAINRPGGKKKKSRGDLAISKNASILIPLFFLEKAFFVAPLSPHVFHDDGK